MNRTFRVWIAAFVLLAVVLGHTSWAGESDGIAGYSMRLKNKDFTTGGDGGGTGNVVSGQKNEQVVAPNTLAVAKADRFWLVSVPFRLAMFTIWIR